MGTLKRLSCKKCAHEWLIYQGIGIMGANFFCNLCNNKYYSSYSVPKSNELPLCDCGGVFELDPINFVCPKCKSTKVAVEDAGFWD